MFFWLACEGSPSDVDWSGYVDELDNLGEAGFKGDHLVLGDRPVLKEILLVQDISRKSRAYFESAVTKYSTVAGLKREIDFILVSPHCHDTAFLGGQRTIALTCFKPDNSAMAAHLLVEHLHDYEVIGALGQTEIDDNHLGGLVKLTMMPSAGGGGGTHLVLSTLQRNPLSLGLCVVDSDRSHAKDVLGNTASSCLDAQTSSWKWNVHVLIARELENVIPPQFIEVAGQSPLASYPHYYDDRFWPVYGYLDFKVPDNLCRFLSLDSSSASYVDTMAAIRALAQQPHECGTCLAGPACSGGRCFLNEARPRVLAAVADWLRLPANRFPRKFSKRVSALNELVTDVVRVGVAARWSMI